MEFVTIMNCYLLLFSYLVFAIIYGDYNNTKDQYYAGGRSNISCNENFYRGTNQSDSNAVIFKEIAARFVFYDIDKSIDCIVDCFWNHKASQWSNNGCKLDTECLNNTTRTIRCHFQSILDLIKFAEVLINFACIFKLFEDKVTQMKPVFLYKECTEGTEEYPSYYYKHNRLFRLKTGKHMFTFRNIPGQTYTVYPFSLNQFANDLVREHKSPSELMNYEWSRYLSFKTFPIGSVMTPMRLAQAGFYYTGRDEEVKCFCCGVTNGDWTVNETAIEAHKRLSPRCRFICGELTDNTGIHYNEYYGDINREMRMASARNIEIDSGANGGLLDMTNTDTPLPQTLTEGATTALKDTSKDKSNNESFKDAAALKDQTSIDVKHPSYADQPTRMASFIGWESMDAQDPVHLSGAGFFYTGVRDFVRCFHCGVGLKNWERGDDPITQHRRWSPNCGFLRQISAGTATNALDYEPREGTETATPSNHNIAPTSFTVSSESASDNNTGAESTTNKDTLEVVSNQEPAAETPRAQNIVRNADQLRPESRLSGGQQSSNGYGSKDDVQTVRTGNAGCAHGQCTKTKKDTAISQEARLLKEQNKQLHQLKICKICMDQDANTVLLPCGHMISCQTCAVSLRNCAICRMQVKRTVRVYQV